MSAELLENVKKKVRSVLISNKDGVPVAKFEGEYKELVCESLPYREFGFLNPSQFLLQKMSDTARLTRNKSGEDVFVAIGNEETAHIVKLVAKQKPKKKKPPKKRAPLYARHNTSSGRHSLGHNPLPVHRKHGATGGVFAGGHRAKPNLGDAFGLARSRDRVPPLLSFDATLGQSFLPPTSLSAIDSGRWQHDNSDWWDYENIADWTRDRTTPVRRRTATDARNSSLGGASLKGNRYGYGGVSYEELESSNAPSSRDGRRRGDYDGPRSPNGPSFLARVVDDLGDWNDGNEGRRSSSNGRTKVNDDQRYDQLFFNSGRSSRETTFDGRPTGRSPRPGSGGGSEPPAVRDLRDKITEQREARELLQKRRARVGDGAAGDSILVRDDSFEHAFTKVSLNSSAATPSPLSSKKSVVVNSSGSLSVKVLVDLPEKPANNGQLYRPQLAPRLQIQEERRNSNNDEPVEQRSTSVKSPAQPPFSSTPRERNNKAEKVTDAQLKLLRSKVLEILDPQGVWSDSLAKIYEERYMERPPANLVDLVETWNDVIFVDKLSNRKILYSRRNMKKDSHKATTPQQPEKQMLLDSGPAALKFPDEKKWDVMVCYVCSTKDIAVQLLGENYQEKLDLLEDKLKSLPLVPVANVTEGMVCLVCEESETEWEKASGEIERKSETCYHRVKFSGIADGKATFTYLDHGNSNTVELNQLYTLPPKFNRLPYQAVKCSLAGLENFADDEFLSQCLEDVILGKTFEAEVVGSMESIPSLTLIDKQQDLNVNEKIEELALKPRLPKGESFGQAYVSHVSLDGTVYLHFPGPGFDRLNNIDNDILDLILSDHYNPDSQRLPDVKDGAMFVVKATISDEWTRAKVLHVVSSTRVLVQYVDYGDSEEVNVLHLIPLSFADRCFRLLPYQAVGCRIVDLPTLGIRWSDAARLRLVETLPTETAVMVRITNEGETAETEDRLITVDMRVNIDGKESLLTDVMTADKDLWKISSPQHVDVPLSGSRVYITHCEDPSNLKGFPASYYDVLSSLSVEMESYYNEPTNFELIPSMDCLVPGELFAVKHSDGHWYRARVCRVMPTGLKKIVSVLFVDFGDVSIPSLINFRYLSEKFRQLPLLSFTMKLAGLVYDTQSWSRENAEVLAEVTLDRTYKLIIPESVDEGNLAVPLILYDPQIDLPPGRKHFVHKNLFDEHLVRAVATVAETPTDQLDETADVQHLVPAHR